MKTVTLVIPPEWQSAARYVGHRHVAPWIRCLIEDFLESGAGRYFPLLPLEWHEETFQAIRSADGRVYDLHEVRGLVAGPFGIYRGKSFNRGSVASCWRSRSAGREPPTRKAFLRPEHGLPTLPMPT